MSTTDPASLQFVVQPLDELIASLPSEPEDAAKLKDALSAVSVNIKMALKGAIQATDVVTKVVVKTAEAVCAAQERQQTAIRGEQKKTEQESRSKSVWVLLIGTLLLFAGAFIAIGCGAGFAAREWSRVAITLTVSWTIIALGGIAFFGRRNGA